MGKGPHGRAAYAQNWDRGMDGSTDLPFPTHPGNPTSNSPQTSVTKMAFGVINNCCRAKCSNTSLCHSLTQLVTLWCFWLAHSLDLMTCPLPLPTSFHHLPHTSHLRPPPLSVTVVPNPPEHVPARLTKTLMASCRGPLVFRLSLPCSTVYSHSKPISMNTWLLASWPLAFRMKFPVA